MKLSASLLTAGVAVAIGGTGCEFLGGAAVGAGGTSAAYEYQNHEALEDLEDDFEDGRISRDEYLERKKEIEKGSIIY